MGAGALQRLALGARPLGLRASRHLHPPAWSAGENNDGASAPGWRLKGEDTVAFLPRRTGRVRCESGLS
jgi:hypothetical protein